MDTLTALEAERQETLERLTSLTGDYDAVVEASRNDNADDEHDPEGATIAFERSQIGALIRRTHAHLDDVDAALDRYWAGTYGVCQTCGRAIDEGRLEARPTAKVCVRCVERKS